MNGTLMRMMVLLLAALGGTMLLAAPLPPSANLLANPSFLQAQGDVAELAAGWAPYQCGYTRTRECSYAPEIDGPWSCRISGAGGADERGLGGTNTSVRDGLPEHGTFAATNSIYVASHTQGDIYGAYVTARYADGTEQTFSFVLTAAQIAANMGAWKTYRLTFTTDPEKKLNGITHWCLVWAKGEQKFIGTVYFDEVELRRIEPVSPAGVGLPFVLASRVSTPPQIDGVMDDDCWRHSLQLPPFLLSHGIEAATEQTQAQLAWDENQIYIFLECFESILDPVLQQQAAFKATQTAHDSNVFEDDSVEVFLQPSPEQAVYYHIAANSLGTVYDARCPEPGAYETDWDSGAQIGTRVGDKSWTVEMAIPRQSLTEGALAPDEHWRVNLCRSEKPAGEYSCWSPTGGPFHTPERFGLVAFGPPAIGGGTVDLGGLRKGSNRLQLILNNPGPEPRAVAVTAAVATGAGAAEVGRASARVASGAMETLSVDYNAPPGEGILRYEVYQDDQIVLLSPGYPLRTETPFTAWLHVLGKAQTRPLTSFSVAEGELLTLPLVLSASISEEQFREAEVILEVPDYLRLITPLSATRRCPTPLSVEEGAISRDGKPYRRLLLTFGADSVTFAEAREKRMLVLNPLVFRAEFTGAGGPERAPDTIACDVRINGQSRAEGSVPLHLLPPLPRKSPRDIVACNWPCGSTFHGAYFGRLSPEEQLATGESWIRAGFNVFTHSSTLAALYRERGLGTAEGLPGTLNAICQSISEVAAYLRDHPEYQDATRAGKALPGSISPARLIEPDCPVRQMIRDFAGKAARQYEVVSWDYEVPVSRDESIGFGAHNLAAFREFANIPANVELTPEVAVTDYLPQWIDFRCRQNAEVAGLLYEGVKAANPECMFFVYSGYQSAHTQVTYGINWGYVAPHIDQAWCGYGRPVQEIRDTLQALGGKPLVSGELVWLGYGSAYDFDTTEVNLMRRLTDCAGGFMVYYDWFVDGRFYTAVARTAAVAADFEAFFRDGRRDDALVSVEAGDAANVTVYGLGDQRLLCLFGSTAGPQEFRIQLKDLPAGATGLDYWSKTPVAVSPMLTVTVPANGVKVIHVRVPDANFVPAAPRLQSPVDGTASDRRPVLVWDHDGGAVCRYRVEVSADPAFPPGATFTRPDLASGPYVVTETLDENGTYHWRVRAVDMLTGRESDWSPVGRFTLGVLGVTVQPTVFSPNGDGAYDSVALQAELRSEAPWTVTVADADGRTVKRVTGEGVHPSASWDGRDEAGALVAEGYYEVRLAVRGRQIATEKIELNQRFGVPNPDLERWCFWRPVALEGGATQQDYHVAAGDRSYSLMLSGADPEARAYWSNYRSGTEIPIEPGKTYSYSGLLKCDMAEGSEALISLHFFTAEDRWAAIPGLEAEWNGIEATCTGEQDWTELSVSCETPPNAAKAVLFFSIRGQGRAWLGAAEFGEKAE